MYQNESFGDFDDPWALLDPHMPGGLPEKPFKKGDIKKYYIFWRKNEIKIITKKFRENFQSSKVKNKNKNK